MEYLVFRINRKLKKKLLKVYLFFILPTVYCLLSTSLAHAQDFNLGIYPPIIQINATPPISVHSPIQIQNFSDNPVSLNVEYHPFTPNSDGTVNVLWNNSLTGNDTKISSKIQLLDDQGNSITQLVLAPKQVKNLVLHVGLPKDETPGDYYFNISFISKDILTNQNTSSAFTGGLSMNVVLSIGPYATPHGTLDKFSAPFIVNSGPIPVKIEVSNPNPFFIQPRGNLVIYNMFNQIIGKVNLLPVSILGNSQRFIPDDKSHSLDTAVWNEKALFGIYRIRLSLLLTTQGPLFEKNIYFLALPWFAVLGIIIFCGLSTIIVLSLREKLKKNN